MNGFFRHILSFHLASHTMVRSCYSDEFKALVVWMGAYLDLSMVEFLSGMSFRSIQQWSAQYKKQGCFGTLSSGTANQWHTLDRGDVQVMCASFDWLPCLILDLVSIWATWCAPRFVLGRDSAQAHQFLQKDSFTILYMENTTSRGIHNEEGMI